MDMWKVSIPSVHISQITQEIAQITHDGHCKDFESQTCICAIEYEIEKLRRIDDEKEGRKT